MFGLKWSAQYVRIIYNEAVVLRSGIQAPLVREKSLYRSYRDYLSTVCVGTHTKDEQRFRAVRTRRCTEGARALHQEGREVAVCAALYSLWQGMKWVVEENREGNMLL